MNFNCSFFKRSINSILFVTSVYLYSTLETALQMGGRMISIASFGSDAEDLGINELVFSSIGGYLILLAFDFFCCFFPACSAPGTEPVTEAKRTELIKFWKSAYTKIDSLDAIKSTNLEAFERDGSQFFCNYFHFHHFHCSHPNYYLNP